MHDLIDARSFQFYLLIISITQLHEGIYIVAAALWLKSQFTTRTVKGLRELPRRFFVSLSTVVDLEGRGAMKDKGS